MVTQLERNPKSLSSLATKLFESLGLLNKGSADIAAGVVDKSVAEQELAVTPPSLNVTRVGGVAALIASAGAAALALFNVDKGEDPAGVVAAAYGGTALIVTASLIAVAVIVSADIRARCLATHAEKPGELVEAEPAEAAATSSQVFRTAWDDAVRRLEGAKDGLVQARGNGLAYARLWLESCGAAGIVEDLTPPASLRDEHARMSASLARISGLLEKLVDDQSSQSRLGDEIIMHVADMRSTVINLPT